MTLLSEKRIELIKRDAEAGYGPGSAETLLLISELEAARKERDFFKTCNQGIAAVYDAFGKWIDAPSNHDAKAKALDGLIDALDKHFHADDYPDPEQESIEIREALAQNAAQEALSPDNQRIVPVEPLLAGPHPLEDWPAPNLWREVKKHEQ